MTQHNITPARRRPRVKAAAFAFVLAFPAVVGFAVTATAAPKGAPTETITSGASVKCNGVFDGKTPNDPIVLESTPTVTLGSTVAHTITWVATGVTDVDLVDCFLVDYNPLTGKSDGSLDPRVVPMNTRYETKGINAGNKILMISVPNDPDLIGHMIWARVKCTQGCTESRSAAVPFGLVVPDPIPDPDPTGTPTPDPTPTETPTEEPTPDPTPTETPTEEPTPDPSPTESPTEEPTPDPSPAQSPTEEPTPDPPVTGGNQVSNDPDDSTVFGTRTVRRAGSDEVELPKALAKTGPETTVIAWLGSLFLAIGIAFRYVRFSPLRTAFAGQGGTVPASRNAAGSVLPASVVRYNAAILSGRRGDRRWFIRRS